jgi:prepilin-type N-terminal cleavage/methylation domain-containing protein
MLPHLPRRSPSAARDDGFTLLEVIVALGIVVVIVTALAQLVAMSVRANVLARTTTTATILAQQKMEELLSEAAADLEPSPAGALTQNIDGSFDFLARDGRMVGNGAVPPPGSDYVRRWSIEPLMNSARGTLILQVLVTSAASGPSGQTSGSVTRTPDHVRIAGAKSGKAF